MQRFGFDLLELGVSATLPRPKVLAKYRQERPDLILSLRLHPEVAQVGPAHPDVARTQEAVRASGAQFVVIPTGPRFSPSIKRKKPLRALADALRIGETQVCWEPRGVWSSEEAVRWSHATDTLLVRDLTQEEAPPGPVVYTRLLPLGVAAKVTQHALETLADRLQDAEQAYVVIQGDGAKRARRELRSWFEEES